MSEEKLNEVRSTGFLERVNSSGHEDKKKPEPGKKKRNLILSIDGGGVKGLVPALTLEAIKLAVDSKIKTNFGKIVPWEFQDAFEIIAGTSTGSIIAAGLCSPKPLQPEDIVKIYRDFSRYIFPPWPLIGSLSGAPYMGILGIKYDPEPLQSILEYYLKGFSLEDVGKAGKAQLVACAYDLDQRQPRFFFSWWQSEDGRREHEKRENAYWKGLKPGEAAGKEFRGVNWTLVEVCRASSAVPLFLPSYNVRNRDCPRCLYDSAKVQSYDFVDGGLFANNPVFHGLAGLIDIKGKWPTEDVVVVSLGTGYVTSRPKPAWGTGQISEIIGISTDGHSHAAHDAFKFILEENKLVTYKRFTPEFKFNNPEEEFRFDDVDKAKLKDMETRTREWLIKKEDKINKVAQFIYEELKDNGTLDKNVMKGQTPRVKPWNPGRSEEIAILHTLLYTGALAVCVATAWLGWKKARSSVKG
eukprot:TRINITY_DN45819_c0_g1_i1.p1 TRINITY_DN45819_c0_g1~~TRINITY_DN45819_c0_g1_i1.p1  ORF type:complete len:469 (-),score=104.95 TRINITY_DN45819_c0_g1_i1:153-1559(-)